MASTLAEYIASQEELVREAALALPHQFSQCTYTLGPLRSEFFDIHLRERAEMVLQKDRLYIFALHVQKHEGCVQHVQ